MRIVKYVPKDMYGFCEDDEGNRVFFHLSRFNDFVSDGYPVPPIVGESVEVFLPEETVFGEGRAPKAERVLRKAPPKRIQGKISRFSPERGYGFISGTDGVSYYLHRVEVLHGKLPGRNMTATFVPGFSRGSPRACHVEIED